MAASLSLEWKLMPTPTGRCCASAIRPASRARQTTVRIAHRLVSILLRMLELTFPMPSKPTRRARPAEKAPPAPPPPPPPKPAPAWLRPLILALAAVLLIGLFSGPFRDADSWTHLKTGQYIVENHRLTVPDPFAFTTAGHQNSYPGEAETANFNERHEWLAQSLMYLVWAAAGFPGIILARALFVAAFCAFVGLTAHARGAGFYGSIIAALAAASVIQVNAVDRPQVVTYALLGLTLYLLESRRWLWALPPIFLLWANMHGGFVMGWVLVGAYCAESLYLRWRGKPVADERRLWLVAAISIPITILNPNGLRIIQVLFQYRHSGVQTSLLEWQRTNYWEPSPYAALLYGGALALLWARGKARIADWILYPLFAAASLLAVRNIFLVALLAPILIVIYFPGIEKIKKRALPAAAEFAVALLLAIAVVARTMSPSAFQFRTDESQCPKGAADFLIAHHITAPMFNTYLFGSYLIWRLWPQERVFTDGWGQSESVFQDSLRIALNADSTGGKSGEQLLADYGIEVIVMNGFEFYSGRIYYLPAALSDPSQKEWKLVYQDDTAMVFMRHPPPDVRPLNSLDALTSMESQCAKHIRMFPQENGCAAELSRLFSTIGDPIRARKWAQ